MSAYPKASMLPSSVSISQWLCVPFILESPASVSITFTAVHEVFGRPWLGSLRLQDAGIWLDDLLLVVKSVTRAMKDSGSRWRSG